MYSYGPPHIAEPKQDDQLEPTYNSSVRIRDIALRTSQKRWTIGRSGERGSGISTLAARHDDDEIYIYIYNQPASEGSEIGLFAYRISEEFHINLWECSMYGYCYTFCCCFFSIQVYITKRTYRAYRVLLKGKSNLVTLLL